MDVKQDPTPTSTLLKPEAITEDMAKQAGMPRAALVEFARCYFRRVDDRYRRRLTDDQVLRRLVSFAASANQRKGSEIKVRVSVPHEQGLDPSDDVVVLETCMNDQRFIVDTLRLTAQGLGLKEVASVNVIIHVQRDAEGRIVALNKTEGPGFVTESATHFVLIGARETSRREQLFAEVTTRLAMSATTVGDFMRFRRTLKDFENAYEFLAQVGNPKGPAQDELREGTALLQWLLEDHFLFMAGIGYRESGGQLTVHSSEGLGTSFRFTSDQDPLSALAKRVFAAPANAGPVVQVFKTDHDSRMHRLGKLDAIFLRRFDDTGRPDGGMVLTGLFSRSALSYLYGNVPILRRRLARMFEIDEIRPASHLYKATTHAFNSLPLNYLFEASESELHSLVRATVDAESSGETTVHIDLTPERGFAWAFVLLHRENFSELILEGVRERLSKELGASHSDYHVGFGVGDLAIMSLYFTGCTSKNESIEKTLRTAILDLCTPWRDRFLRALNAKFDGATAKRLYGSYAEAFPEKYHLDVSADQAASDVRLLDLLASSGQIQFDVLAGSRKEEARLRLYRTVNLALSDILPIFDHLGFRVLDQEPTTVDLPGGANLVIDTFRLSVDPASGEVDYVQSKARLIDGLRAVFEKRMVSDPLNRLMLRPGLGWEDVDVLRAYLGYSMQIGPFFAPDVVHRVLHQHAALTGALAEYFQSRFHPKLGAATDAGRVAKVTQARKAVTDALTRITDATEDRVYRIFLNLMDATVRTNLYRPDRKGHYISFKIDCAKLEKCPEPRPIFEIYVHHAEMEGCHLRGGKVARGGIRWSDRLEDYRTEIFGLMRTQMVKNVLIVPVGAKGGFVVKGKPKAGQDRKAYGDAMYEILIRGLLDVTDNRINNEPARPKNVVTHDEYDPYLVVAADKGTAHLSDTANRLSAEYKHWLGDAFASGGSAGYDHKVEGITAKGAWACVRHHFLRLGVDPNTDIIRVVGVGDLSGDVFGNGLLRSRTMKLVGAFNHMHIFLDPDPDPEASYLERERMFKLPRSGWTDYRKEVMSKGGGIWLRTEKSIPLSPELQKLLATDRKEMNGDEVVQTLLKLDVDLLYNGGIGTYIKASDEDHREVGDKANDAVRVNARDVRARVIGEGGNLGMTQKARIEYCIKGGHCNTDAIDNSGGVDLSDHEVNLKILFEPEVSANRMTLADRDKLLREICAEVDERVVADNDTHALMLTLDEVRSKRDPFSFVRAVEFLAERGVMDPAIEKLPTQADLKAHGLPHGLMRPELAKLDAFAKMFVFNELIKMDVNRIPRREHLLTDYFPKLVHDKHRDVINRHMLLREILATVWNNHMLTYAGGAFFPEMVWDSERSVADVATAYTAADGWLDAFHLRKRLLGLKKVPAAALFEGVITLEEGLREAAAWLLHFLPGDQLTQRIGDGQDLLKQGIPYRECWKALVQALPTAAPAAQRRVENDMQALVKTSLPEDMAREVALSCQWAKVFPVYELARRKKRTDAEAANAYLTCGQVTGLNAIIFRIGRQPSTDPWEAQALRSLRQAMLRTLFSLADKSLDGGVDATLKKDPAFNSVGQDIQRLLATNAPVSISVMVVLAERLHKALVRL